MPHADAAMHLHWDEAEPEGMPRSYEIKYREGSWYGCFTINLSASAEFKLFLQTTRWQDGESVRDDRMVEWLRGELQSAIHQIDDYLDPDRGEPSDDPETQDDDPEFPAGEFPNG